MSEKVVTRMPEVRSLYEILPKGSAGGKEFARLVDLLLFHQAKKDRKKITIFNDAAGDYKGLDSFEGDIYSKEGITGYQYKFFPCPFSKKHRKEIIESLLRAANANDKQKMNKWILVTPQDMIESSNRKDGGDVSWFEGLRQELNLNFEIEHWGHKKLQLLFMQTPPLCLYYYPELVPEGSFRRKTIQDIRNRYNDNLKTLYYNIEFVGMSVYKQEATAGVPMDSIYIPLTVVPDSGRHFLTEDFNRKNPLKLIEIGSNNVIIGDPGSGKSTLLRFLALSGISRPLQKRYKSKPHNRLPIIVTLRRYADELKTRPNLSLLTYIQENIQGDFNLADATIDFFEFYLESGQTILLFDGLDELPDHHYKEVVRNRIRSLITTYPGNTVVVTSRIVGYENPFRFSDDEFKHYRVTKLLLPEMKQFVHDWYSVRIENNQNQMANVNDLIRILEDDNHVAIRELAENPLLLTIVTLVHRIDAVLPDERIVLYQKCTETLLTSWHTWKFRNTEVKNKGKIERRNKRRMEAIAYWMHCQSGGTATTQRAVVPYNDLKRFLTKHIADFEKNYDPENDPEDIAEDFLEFVKKRAGLLIEVGDKQYSFLHLTFQEYLTASNIITNSEKDGVQYIWKMIEQHLSDPRWHEVIRLLIAELKSDDSQEFLIDQIINANPDGTNIPLSLLVGGILSDGVEPASSRKLDIFKQMITSMCITDETDHFQQLVAVLKSFLVKDDTIKLQLDEIFIHLRTCSKIISLNSLLLVAYSLDLSHETIQKLRSGTRLKKDFKRLLGVFFDNEIIDADSIFRPSIDYLWAIQKYSALDSPGGNQIAALLNAIFARFGSELNAKSFFETLLTGLASGLYSGPFNDYGFNIYQLYLKNSDILDGNLIQKSEYSNVRTTTGKNANKVLSRIISKSLKTRNSKENFSRIHAIRELSIDRAEAAIRLIRSARFDYLDAVNFNALFSADIFLHAITIIIDSFNLQPRQQWLEALKLISVPKMIESLRSQSSFLFSNVEKNFETGEYTSLDINLAAGQLLFDVWLNMRGYYSDKNDTHFSRLSELTEDIKAAPLQIANCIRDIAFGNLSRSNNLQEMLTSEDYQFREIFKNCCWRE